MARDARCRWHHSKVERRNFILGAAIEARRRRKTKPAPSLFTEDDRRQLLKAFSDNSIRTELERRLLSIYTVEELEMEARRRGLRE